MLSKEDYVYSKLCPHRGLGEENSLAAIKAGINTSPLMVEFDIQLYKNALYLGHPPEITNTRLIDVLDLFKNTKIFPKIDIKLENKSYEKAIGLLIQILNKWGPKTVLANIDGTLTSDEFLRAENILLEQTSSNVLLNIDLDRYSRKSLLEINDHLSKLVRQPYSLSPNLENNTKESITFVKIHGIKNIHFWSNPNKTYTTRELYDRLELCKQNNITAYLDIKPNNIKK